MIDSIMLVDDESLFHLVFEDSCNLFNIALQLQSISSTSEAEKICQGWQGGSKKPDCVFVDLNMVGSPYDGIELVRRINHVYGNGVVIGIISSSEDKIEIEKSKAAGAQFWLIKSDDLETRLVDFVRDYDGFKNKTTPFKVYR